MDTHTCSHPVVLTEDVEHLVCNVRNACEIAADYIETPEKKVVPYAVYAALRAAEELYTAFYASTKKGFRARGAS